MHHFCPGWPEHLPPRHVGLSWAHPEGLQQSIWTGQRAADTGVNWNWIIWSDEWRKSLVKILYPQLQLAALHTLFPLLSADLGNGRRALSSGGRGLRRRLRECQKSAIACNTKVLAARTSALQPERVSGEQIVMQQPAKFDTALKNMRKALSSSQPNQRYKANKKSRI